MPRPCHFVQLKKWTSMDVCHFCARRIFEGVRERVKRNILIMNLMAKSNKNGLRVKRNILIMNLMAKSNKNGLRVKRNILIMNLMAKSNKNGLRVKRNIVIMNLMAKSNKNGLRVKRNILIMNLMAKSNKNAPEQTLVLTTAVQQVQGVCGDGFVGGRGGPVVDDGPVGPEGRDGLEGGTHEVLLLGPEGRQSLGRFHLIPGNPGLNLEG